MNARETYEKWRELFASDAQLQAELASIAGDAAQIEDRFYTELSFGTAGMRGVLGAGTNRMNVYAVRRATQGLANFLLREPEQAKRGVAIGYDSRQFSKEFALQTALTLCANGIAAFLYDELRPVALVSYAVRELHCIAGIVITASHNPKEYNGYKVYGEDGGQLSPEMASEVLTCIRALGYHEAKSMTLDSAEQSGLFHWIGQELDDTYIQKMHTLCIDPDLCKRMGAQLSIVYTPLNGSGNRLVRRILREVGFEKVSVVSEQELPDPQFTTVGVPNPGIPAAMKLAIAQAVREGADVAFGTDPDCDRLGVACKNDQGEFVSLSGNQIGCLLLHYILEGRKLRGTLPAVPAAVKSVVTTEMARAIVKDYGATLFDVLTGFKFIAEKIHEMESTPGAPTFVFGFEESYGYLSGTFVRDKDGVNASMLLAECIAHYKEQGKTLYQGLEALFQTYGYYMEATYDVTLEGKDGLARMQDIMDTLRAQPPQAFGPYQVLRVRDYLHGYEGLPPTNMLYFELENGAWLCVRPSGTEPKMKLYSNVVQQSEQAAQAALAALEKAAIETIQEIG